jgi:hypothetical protein
MRTASRTTAQIASTIAAAISQPSQCPISLIGAPYHMSPRGVLSDAGRASVSSSRRPRMGNRDFIAVEKVGDYPGLISPSSRFESGGCYHISGMARPSRLPVSHQCALALVVQC